MASSSNFITFFVLSISLCVKQYLCAEYPVGPRCQIKHSINDLSKEDLLKYGQLEAETHLRDAVKNILIPRVVGTDGHKQVRKYISDSLKQMEWSVEYDTFEATVPILDDVYFHNIIAKLNPKAERFLVLTCHYDSKYKVHTTLVGTLDAVPCAMLLNMAHVLQAALNPFRKTELSLMFVFFDGEESPDDYNPLGFPRGRNHLADGWQENGILNKLDILVNLDLIGLADTTIYSYFANTEALFLRFIALEKRLANAKMLHSCKNPKRFFETGGISSHHLKGDPFLKEKVPILHLRPKSISLHTQDDNESAIDYDATEDISRIIRLFIIEYLFGGIKK
ncbi:glutaminyl-peptide cyclotransferase-like [Eurosta solidaginis]|uniref:glutaminyl-peptide cyclotransferase-like n=1 Tax=Eurosta solidaginis TaxID=178769 RepID=UPI003530FBC3